MTQLQTPLVPPDVDLRDFQFMPLYGDVLLDSETWLLCEAEEKVAALTLWWKSWHQLPAGSLPENDKLLSQLAGYGVAIKSWLAVKPAVMRGWLQCSDGRYYHRFLAARVAESWLGKVKKNWSRECDRIRKENKRLRERNEPERTFPAEPTINTIGFPPEIVAMSARSDAAFRRMMADGPQEQTDIPTETTVASAGIPPADDQIPPKKPLKGQGQGQGQGEKEREARKTAPTRPKTRLPEDWQLPADWRAWAVENRPDLNPDNVAIAFRDWWTSADAKRPLKADWLRTWQTWVRNQEARGQFRATSSSGAAPQSDPPSRIAYRKAFAEWDAAGRRGDQPRRETYAYLDVPQNASRETVKPRESGQLPLMPAAKSIA